MFKRILLPTDGSAFSRQAVAHGVRLAREHGAEVIGLHVLPEPRSDRLEAWMHHDPHFAARRQALFERLADDHLAHVAGCARSESVPWRCTKIPAQDAATAIVEIARASHCDLIHMASHGWNEHGAPMPGGVTLGVLIRSPVPVLIFKPTQADP
ncbi:universal stress protein [Noviherbaspirillum galbum]|uniref:Universal stress protein n=1 Tax=Noviherbaspirillum galbum TaxID=2709383 RepID=A0A6B3SPB6_9BURK|nr:universal stress protein [Noviherbaspirillum galbum]NEX62358.1 universal stress protein [Noviherbaspirillum galbum]